MRELKFRAWDKPKEYFIYFDFNNRLFSDQENNISFKCSTVIGDHDYENDRFIFEQYTGLNDKNDKPIYEGDIIKTSWGEVGKVFYDKDSASFTFERNEKTHENFWISEHWQIFDKCEVIGNINETDI